MLVFLNGHFLPEAQAVVPVNDRGFLLGDGLFETMRVVNGSGRPEMIGPQAQALVNAMDAHRSIAGCAPSPNEIAAVLNIVAKAERVALLNLEREAEMRATQNLISRALPIAASRLNEIRTHAPGGVEGLTPDDYTVGSSPAWGA